MILAAVALTMQINDRTSRLAERTACVKKKGGGVRFATKCRRGESRIKILVGPETQTPGPAGPQGPAGEKGSAGDLGPAGVAGADGATGPTGPEGSHGIAGTNGINGLDGADGATGATGPTGPAGDSHVLWARVEVPNSPPFYPVISSGRGATSVRFRYWNIPDDGTPNRAIQVVSFNRDVSTCGVLVTPNNSTAKVTNVPVGGVDLWGETDNDVVVSSDDQNQQFTVLVVCP